MFYLDGVFIKYDYVVGLFIVQGVKIVFLEVVNSVLVKCLDIIFDGVVMVKGLLFFMNGIVGQGGDNGNVIIGDLMY